MPDLLLELFSEEIPARMQARAAEDLCKAVTERLVETGLVYEGAKALVTPQRLVLTVHGVPPRQPDMREEKKGPRVGAPENAIAGFLKGAGLKSISEAKVQPDKKGDFYVAVIEKPGRAAIEVIADILPQVIRDFPWPKSMRWGKESARRGAFAHGGFQASGFDTGSLRWVRPLHSIVATFGPETEEPEIVPFAVDGIAAGNQTRGHRFMAPQPFTVRRFADYQQKLDRAKVVLDAERRRDIILAEAKHLAFAQGLELVEDEGLLAEVAGLVEWPVMLMGSFDAGFLHIPEEVIRATIRNNQKCFVLRDAAHATLVAKFILAANVETEDGGQAIVAGNERVIRARLADAKFFYQTDLKTRLEDRLPKFKNIVFHEKLGTQWERIERIERLAAELAPLVGADVEKAKRAALLCKADLLTEIVGEFPELQGTMGKYYAEAQGEDEAVAHAIEDHYSPKGPDDFVPADPVSIAVALADKIDTLAGFWLVDEKPTSSKDPYGLRRAALGLIRLIVSNNIKVRLERYLFPWAYEIIFPISDRLYELDRNAYDTLAGESIAGQEAFHKAFLKLYEETLAGPILGYVGYPENYTVVMPSPGDDEAWEKYVDELRHDVDDEGQDQEYVRVHEQFKIYLSEIISHRGNRSIPKTHYLNDQYVASTNYLEGFNLHRALVRAIWPELYRFLVDRLKVQLRAQGARHDLVDAVFALEGQDDLLLIVRRVEALGKFLDSEDGKNLLAGYKRATNIVRIEEKRDGREYTSTPDPRLYTQAEERALARAIEIAKVEAARAVVAENFESAMRAMAKLRPGVDAFFDKVTVNVDDQTLRENRLKLLNEIRAATGAVADFSRIEG